MTTAPPHPAAAAAAANPAPPWHLAGSLVSLKAAVDAHWPGRDKRSDGGIGNAAHQAEGSASDHNPWLGHAVRAYDFTATQPGTGIVGVDGAWLAEMLRIAGQTGDDRLAGRSGDVNDNGYVIYDHHITAPDFSRWVPYDGQDPHTTHVHVSVTRDAAGYEDGRPWPFIAAAPQHPAPATPAPAGHLDPIPPQPAGHVPPAVGPHAGNTAHEAPAPVLDVDGPEPTGYAPAGQDAIGAGSSFRAQFGNTGPKVKALQVELNKSYPAYAALDEDGDYGSETAGVVQDFARRVAGDPACPAEHRDALAGADGDNVGPHLAAVFPLYGIHV
jgi:hypothetical protein